MAWGKAARAGWGRRRWWLLGIVVAVLFVGGAGAAGYLMRPAAKTSVFRGRVDNEGPNSAAAQAAARLRTTESGSSSYPVTCSLYKYGNSVRLTLEGPGNEAYCEGWAQALSGGGGYWVSGVPPLAVGLHEICALTGPKGSTTAIVEDTGDFGELGTTLCGSGRSSTLR